jgi:hypothetical protein
MALLGNAVVIDASRSARVVETARRVGLLDGTLLSA